MAEPFWLTNARKYLGQREIPGVKHNPVIVRWWALIRAPFTDDETPYCAAFVGGMLEECGIRSSRSAAARSYLRWGVELPGPAVGSIAVLERGPVNGHVTFVVGKDGRGNLMGLGGNQSNMVKISPFPVNRVLGCRWPAGQGRPPVMGFNVLPTVASSDLVSVNEQ